MSDHAELTEAQAQALLRLVQTIRATLVKKSPYLSVTGALAALDVLAARCDALENALREIANAAEAAGPGEMRARWIAQHARAALAATDTTRERVTHGPDCPCTPCQAEDWEKIAANLPAGERQET
jgi:hypothetical protein